MTEVNQYRSKDSAMRRQVSQRAPKRSDFFSGFGAGFGPNRGDLAFLDEKLQEALAWEQGGSSVFAFYIHVFAQTAYSKCALQ